MTPTPDALYARREEAGSRPAPPTPGPARLAATPLDFEAAWKLSRARYYIGTNGRVEGRRGALDAGMAAARTAIALQPSARRAFLAGRQHGRAGRVRSG